jgi:hypothetical protein
MNQYAKRQAVDVNGAPMVNLPSPFPAIARNANTNQAASSVITLTDNTTMVEVAAQGTGGAVVRWVPATETAAVAPAGSVIAAGAGLNFDHVIPAAQVRRFVVPIENVVTQYSVVGANVQNGLYKRLAVISTAGTSSVLVTEY